MLFYAPAGASWGTEEWVPLGEAGTCDLPYEEEDPETGAILSLGPRCMSVSMPLRRMSTAGFWLLFRRRHPRLKAIRSAYRHKAGRRRFRR